MIVRPVPRRWKWFDSLLWLGLAGRLAALLVPATSQQETREPSTTAAGPSGAMADGRHADNGIAVTGAVHASPAESESETPPRTNEQGNISTPSAEPPIRGPVLAPPR